MDILVNLGFTVRSIVLAVTSRLQWLPPLLARIAVGSVFLRTGWGKLHNLDKITAFFRELGIPNPEL
ncbi:MAG TPA: DoxX family membrane protein, partial [Bdellovibrionota bacterium]|nr:DoxX family membrane protein [Bdellovibrionota bacterium]